MKVDWDAWAARSLAEEDIVRLILDGTVIRTRLDKKATNISVLAASRRQHRRSRERLFAFTRLPPAQWKSARTTNAIERLNEEFRRRIKTQTVLPCAETLPMLLWALLASGQITMAEITEPGERRPRISTTSQTRPASSGRPVARLTLCTGTLSAWSTVGNIAAINRIRHHFLLQVSGYGPRPNAESRV